MKVRVKFSKLGAMKFIGHLDTMRYFQKALRRADIPVAYSGGFNPHIIMSFAAPLGVGITSEGEYFDVELSGEMSGREIVSRLNAEMADGFAVHSAVRVEDGKAGKAMSLVAAADYRIFFREGCAFCDSLEEAFSAYMRQPVILIRKKTKRSEKTVDIKPFIYEYRAYSGDIFLRLAAASSNYTRPEQVMDSFAEWLGITPQPFACMVHRLEVYADLGDEDNHNFVTLESLGETIV